MGSLRFFLQFGWCSSKLNKNMLHWYIAINAEQKKKNHKCCTLSKLLEWWNSPNSIICFESYKEDNQILSHEINHIMTVLPTKVTNWWSLPVILVVFSDKTLFCYELVKKRNKTPKMTPLFCQTQNPTSFISSFKANASLSHRENCFYWQCNSCFNSTLLYPGFVLTKNTCSWLSGKKSLSISP